MRPGTLTRKKALARTGWWPRRKPLRSRPSRRARPDEPLKLLCRAQIDGVCTGKAEHRHHLLMRSQGGTDDPWNTADVCDACHGHIHAHPAWAYERGLLLHRCPGSGVMAPADADGLGDCLHCGTAVPVQPEGSGWGGAELAVHGWRGAA